MIRAVTWNVRGLGNPHKARHVLAYLDRHQIEIALLQETHYSPMGTSSFGRKWGTLRFFSSYSMYSIGVVALIKRSVHFMLVKHISDFLGSMVAVA